MHAPIVSGEEITLGFCQRRKNSRKHWIADEVSFASTRVQSDSVTQSQSIQQTKTNTEN